MAAESLQPPDLSEQEGDVVRLVGTAHGVDKLGTGGVQERLGGTQDAQEEVEPFVDGGVAGFDEAVGVEQEPVAGPEGDGDGVEADAADAERGSGGQVKQFGFVPGTYDDRGRWPALAMRQCPVWGS